ncbi:MAG: hypothetical protein KatS3mg131_0619 [Candidatus Tectimicrobiota bacterium]|nr:MAG: hypothetical protein KatS3mg131_0619 [Candidatus Tectomicrobia bacterium]
MARRLLCVFPGQGSQFVGMGRDLYAADAEVRQLYQTANEVLGYDLQRLCFEGPEEALRLTANTQPAILVHSIAAWTVLARRGLRPVLLAGHSLGEYTALVAAGVLRFADAVRLVHCRGAFMQEAVPPGAGSMAAMLGMRREDVEALCAEFADGGVLQPANYNAPDQIVIAGETARVQAAVAAVKTRRLGRAVLLNVSAPFHCRLLQPAAERLAAVLAQVPIGDFALPVLSNVTATPYPSPAAVRELLVAQVCAPVRWEDCMRYAIAQGCDALLEVGAGQGPLHPDAPHCARRRHSRPGNGTGRVMKDLTVRLQDRVAVVTGASRGIGRAIALALGEAGARVVLTCTEQRSAAEAVLAALQAAGGEGSVYQFDVADYAATQAAFDEIARTFGRIDILVNNAGIRRDQLLVRMSPEEWDRVLRVNLSGVFHCSRAAARLMLRQRWGRILAITSVAGLVGNAGQTNYAASKAGIVGFVKALAKELAPRGITVNAIAPGLIATDMTDALPAAQRQTLLQRIPLGRFGTPEEVAACVLFLASEAAQYITGEVITVSGGLTV